MDGDAQLSEASGPGRALEDPALPTLADAFDPETVARGFARAWRTAGRGSVAPTVTGGPADTAYAPGTSCVVTYPVELRGGAEPGRQPAFGVVEVDAAGTRFRRFVDDAALPGLLLAADAATVRDRLSAALGDGDWRPVPIRYKPGRSCVLRYAAGSRESFYGKVFARGAERHAEVLAGLADAAASLPQMPRVVAPVAVFSDLSMVLQPAVVGRSLTEAAGDRSPSVRAASMRAAGGALAALHAASVPAQVTVRWQDDLAEVAGYGPLVRALAPGIAAASGEVLRQLQAIAPTMDDVPVVPSHGACRTDQFLVRNDGAIVVLDLDAYCYADPARDLANALGYLEWRGIRHPSEAAASEVLRQSLIEGYGATAPLPAVDRMHHYRAVTLLRIAGRRLRRLATREWQHLPVLVSRAAGALSR